MDCADIGQAQVIRSYLQSFGLHPRVRDENTRGVAPHFGQVLGKLTLEIPEHEYMEASQALENREQEAPLIIVEEEHSLIETQSLAKKCLLNAILGCTVVPVVCNLYSMALGYRVLKHEKPLSKISRRRLNIALVFNCIGFVVWLQYAPKFLLH